MSIIDLKVDYLYLIGFDSYLTSSVISSIDDWQEKIE